MADPAKPKSFKKNASKTASITSDQRTKAASKKDYQSAIPKYVANRMARRIAFTTGIPTICGMGVFIASYVVVTKGIADIPPSLTLIGSAICFLTGLIGLSYGILSSSWEQGSGSFLGLENIKPNIKRMRSAFSSSTNTQN